MKQLLLIVTLFIGVLTNAQTYTATIESLTLQTNSAYSPTISTPFYESGLKFNHTYNSGYWLGGFAYTNIKDSATAGFNNLYGVKALNGYNNSSQFVVGQDGAVLSATSTPIKFNGFYFTNTTYAYKSMKNGDSFAKKFGGTTGNDPDYLKLIVTAFTNGTKKDSLVLFLANFTYTNNTQDFILNTWQFADLSSLGFCDSIRFTMRSTDISGGFMNTPAFFALDNISYEKQQVTSIDEIKTNFNFAYPNPAKNSVKIATDGEYSTYRLIDLSGRTIQTGTIDNQTIQFNDIPTGIYSLSIESTSDIKVTRLIIE